MITKFKLFEKENSKNPSEYTGDHSAPVKETNDPMYDVSNMFPDMYTDNALMYYGGYGLDDAYVINKIKTAHNRPNRLIPIYRAVPYLNKDIDKEIKKLTDIISHHNKYRFFPVNNPIINEIEKKYTHIRDWDESRNAVMADLINQTKELIKQKPKSIRINDGDWVTTSKLYAKQHGESNLNNNYKIVTKTVKASQLYTDGNSIFEWGYIA